MIEPALPDELVHLEQRLRRRATVPPSGYRAKIMRAVSEELAAQARTARWRFAAAAAAVLMIGANLSIISASVTAPIWTPVQHKLDIAAATQNVQALIPELSSDDARRISITLLTANQSPRIPLAPVISPSNTMRGLR
ncbi:MAG TPA: hypothetical protein VIM11_25760 [Tepidisphaeraceae bacterium]|jgi:anti-sigma-K factor RskA